jgi:TRAP-type transport system small permease protein
VQDKPVQTKFFHHKGKFKVGKRLVETLNGIIKWILIILFFVMVVVVFLQVLFRFVLHQPLAWTEELGRYLLVWITFLGAGYGMSVKAHPSIELFFEKAGSSLKKVLTVISTLLIIFFFWQVIANSFEFISRSMTQTSPVLRLPMGFVYTVIPIASGIFIINLLYVVLSEWRQGAKN